MPVRERTSLSVLAHETRVKAFERQRPKRHPLRCRPVNEPVVQLLHLRLNIHLAQALVDVEILARVHGAACNSVEFLRFESGLLWLTTPLAKLHTFPLVRH